MSAPFRSNAAVALPARTVQNSNIVSDSNLEAASAELSKSGGSAHPVVWVIKDEQELEECEKEKENGGREVCCKELKGADDRQVVDPEILKLLVIGFMDGICVPLALTAGLSVLGSTHLVVIGGVAELIAGSLSMSIGGFLGAQAERDQFLYYTRTTQERVERSCVGEMEREVHDILARSGVDKRVSALVTASLYKAAADNLIPQRKKVSFFSRRFMTERIATGTVGLTPFLVEFGEGMEEITRFRTIWSGALVGIGYLLGGLIPLMPYFIIADNVLKALFWSVGITAMTLFVFGAVQAYYSGAGNKIGGVIYGAFSTLAIGGIATAASYGIVVLLDRS